MRTRMRTAFPLRGEGFREEVEVKRLDLFGLYARNDRLERSQGVTQVSSSPAILINDEQCPYKS